MTEVGSQPRRLVRPRLRFVAGVCAGFAEHTGLPAGLVRAAAVVLALCGGVGVLFYAWLWATTPGESTAARAPATLPDAVATASAEASGAPGLARPRAGRFDEARHRPVTELLLGAALLAVGGALVLRRAGVDVPLTLVIPAIVVVTGLALAWRQFADLRTGSGGSGLLVRALSALVFVALGILLFFVTGESPNAWTVVVASAAVLAGVGLTVAPWLVRFARDLTAERAALAAEAERAEIAAHLHDSVLQTLALIQQKAGSGSEAARLARAQERELRGWLFTGEPVPVADLAGELRAFAAVLEQDHAVRFDVVSVGPAPAVDEATLAALQAAAREAMLNAARHAGGDVSVYIESGGGAFELLVTDRGPGFDPEAAGADRFGVRESIVGRMRRAGGSASIRPGPGGSGTTVALGVPTRVTGDSPAGHDGDEGGRSRRG